MKLNEAKNKKLGHVHLLRNQESPEERHLYPCCEVPQDGSIGLAGSEQRKAFYEALSQNPEIKSRSPFSPRWNSIFLFFNLTSSGRPDDYRNTTVQDAKNFLDEGTDPATPGVSEFVYHYWRTLSYGKLLFGVNTPRNSNGDPLIPTVAAPGGKAQDWGGLINACLDANAEAIWQAAGSLIRGSKRWIPSVALIQNYWTHASAHFGSYEREIDGETYLIGDRTHIRYLLDFVNLPGVPANTARKVWSTLNHEYAHNFLEFWDLYGPQGCTGYWDLLGDNSPPGRMSEVCSVFKERIGWINFKEVIEGPAADSRTLSLRPYTSSGDSIKVIPDPQHNPHEYFVLEYRKSTGTETWRPDGALQEEGLMITHINTRLGVSPTWLLRDAPFFDPEFADHSDNGGSLWTGHRRLEGILYPRENANSFTPYTQPNSDFYGGRRSGLFITNIRLENGLCRFELSISGNTRVDWAVSSKDRCIAGKFTYESAREGQEIFCRNDDDAVLLTHRSAQWFSVARQQDWIGSWNLGPNDREVVGDFDGDGRDEIYIRSDNYAGILKWYYNRFRSLTVQRGWIGRWNLGKDNWELSGDFDGDGRDEIYIRSPEWAGVIGLANNRLWLQSIQHDWIDNWNLGKDNHEHVGKFTQAYQDEILIRSPNWMGLLVWDNPRRRLRLRRIEHDWIGQWNLGPDDYEVVGDFDGDGLDEIYIRSPKWAGIIKWIGNRFRLLWIENDYLNRLDGNADFKIPLTAHDKSYAGKFASDKDGILHRHGQDFAILKWENNQMLIDQHHRGSHIGGWALGEGDQYVLGDFHRLGPDIGDPTRDFITDELTDIFIHNSWGTGMIGINPPHNGLALTWINHKEILAD